MNKKTIITILFALAIKVVGTSNALDFCIDHKDVAIAVNKNITGNQVPDDKGTVGIATNSILMVNRHNGPAVETRKGMESIVSVREYLIVHPNLI